MASGSFEKSFHTGYKLIVDWTSTANQTANTSTVKATVKLYCPYALSINARTGNTVVINGTSYSFDSSAVSSSGGTTHTLGTVTSSAITHNSDGTKSVTITANFKLNATLSGTYYGTQTASGTATLDTIARASTLSCAGGYIGSAVNIVINKAASNFTHTIIWSAGTQSGTVVTKTSASTVSWTIPASLAESMTGTQLQVLLQMTTFNGSTELGSTYTTFWATKNTADKPIITASVEDTNSTTVALTGNSSRLVKYFSTAYCTMTAEGQGGATVNARYIKNGANTIHDTKASFSNVSSNVFTFSATDTYGNTTVIEKTPTMVDYVRLTCYVESANPSTDGTADIQIGGNYFNGSFGSVSNTLTVQYRYSANGGSYTSWVSVTPTKSGNTYTASATIYNLNYQTTYKFQARAVDKLMTVTSTGDPVKSEPVFDWGKDDFKFNVPVAIDGSIEANGCYIMDGDGHEAIATQSDGTLRIGYANYLNNFADVKLYGTTIDCIFSEDFYMNGISMNSVLTNAATSGTWTPKCNVISSYTQRYGTWMKIGDACTICFCIVGTASSSTDTITITGLPFSPNGNHKWQAGGGNFANGLTNQNSAFSGWTIENGAATIYARSTAISTTDKNTRSSGYIGAYSGQTLYMAGTIMYRVA